MKQENIMLTVAIFGLMAISFLFGKWINETKYKLYVMTTESLLNSMYEENPNFLDTVGETDEYADYMEVLQLVNNK